MKEGYTVSIFCGKKDTVQQFREHTSNESYMRDRAFDILLFGAPEGQKWISS